MTKEDTLFRRRLEDLIERSDRIGYPVYSDFLDGGQRLIAETLSLPPQIRMMFIGGYEDAERVIAAFYPAFFNYTMDNGVPEEDMDHPVRALDIRLKAAKFVHKVPGHRDYLGALMGLGIKRETMGDILVHEGGAVLITLESVSAYIQESLTSVGAAEVIVDPIPLADVGKYIPDGQEKIIDVSSARLDAVISKTFNMGRSDALQWVRSGRVHLNWKEMLQNDKAVKAGDLISVRGKGRIRILEEVGTTRSGRIKLKIEKFGS
ncbi:MAG: hypothetical protein K6A77_06000 [Clostridiales bacterium]|nr:hypothetical protein [Clostridiales bacterium]